MRDDAMLLNAEELLALMNGDAEPDRLADLLDRLEQCPESANALRVLVTLRANREEGIEAIRQAAADDATSTRPILHPSARRFATPKIGWGAQALRLAASIALVAVIGVWGANSFFTTASVSVLATTEYRDFFSRETSKPVEPTADSLDSRLERAASALAAENYDEADSLLSDLPNDSEGLVPMYRGMLKYFQKDYEAALIQFNAVDTSSDSGIKHQASWYRANALLALDRPFEAVIVLGQLRSANGYLFQSDAATKYEEVCEAMDINCGARDQ